MSTIPGNTETTESKLFKVVVLIFIGSTAGVTLYNIITFDKIRENLCDKITHQEITTLIWINIIIHFLALLLFFWCIWRSIFSDKSRGIDPNAALGVPFPCTGLNQMGQTNSTNTANQIGQTNAYIITTPTNYSYPSPLNPNFNLYSPSVTALSTTEVIPASIPSPIVK